MIFLIFLMNSASLSNQLLRFEQKFLTGLYLLIFLYILANISLFLCASRASTFGDRDGFFFQFIVDFIWFRFVGNSKLSLNSHNSFLAPIL